jgi:hypothetical protein
MQKQWSTVCGLVMASGLLVAGGSWAAEPAHPERNPQFQKNHPRQTEVLKRVDRERQRVNQEYKQGKISTQQRDQMLVQIHSIRKEDYADARANSSTGTVRGDSYITKGQQGVMNQQENQISKEIRQAGQ